jgi:L-cysteine desulfidase
MAYSIRDILKIEVAPALGCTEPAAIAFGAAAAASLLPAGSVESIELAVDPNIYKNGVGVAIPGADGVRGLDMAAALGALGGDASLKLEALEPIDDAVVERARRFVEAGGVNVILLENQRGLFIRAAVSGGGHCAEAIIRDMHDNIVSLQLDGTDVTDHPALGAGGEGDNGELAQLEQWLRAQPLRTLLALIDDLDEDDYDFLRESVTLNLRLAEYGLKFGSGLGVGKTLERLARQRLIQRDMIFEARKLTSAAADARMAGVKLPAMASAGSGNHGLTAVLPIWAIRDYIDCDEKSVLQAVAFSNLVTAYVKAHTGRLTAICGCSIAAGAGAAAGITLLLGGDLHHIAGAIANVAEDLAGVICDGAKAGCALKLSTAAGTAVQAALFSLQGVNVQQTDGIIGHTVEQTTQNIGTLSTEGMIEADRTILKIMLAKKFSGY